MERKMSKQHVNKQKQSNKKRTAPVAQLPILDTSVHAAEVESDRVAKQNSPVKFFLLWFGLPMMFIGAIAWAMAHS